MNIKNNCTGAYKTTSWTYFAHCTGIHWVYMRPCYFIQGLEQHQSGNHFTISNLSCCPASSSCKYDYTCLWMRCSTECQFVLRSISLHHGVYISLCYGVSVCTTGYQFVLRSIGLYYGVSVCTTEYQFVLRSVSFVHPEDPVQIPHRSRIDPA